MDNQNDTNGQEQDIHRKKNDLQREIIMSEGDLRKISNEKISIEAETRRLKKELDHIRIAMQEKQTRLKKVDQDIVMKSAEISHLKKQLNLL